MSKVSVIDSSTITLFVDIFKGAGRNTIDGKKKGGLGIFKSKDKYLSQRSSFTFEHQ